MAKQARISVLSAAALAVAGCAAPHVDAERAGFKTLDYNLDLVACGFETAGQYATHGLAGAVIGSGVGAIEGATWGAVAGSAGEGAIVGAAVGGVIGAGFGAYEGAGKKVGTVESCVVGKGYALKARS
jgi:hypothetical protein